jgi:hypothetical protein
MAVAPLLFAGDRAEELRKEMWQTTDKDFYIREIPEKWANKSAVIIAKLHRFEYRKKLVVAVLQENQYHHFRIKLLDKNAVNKYSEMSYDADVPGYSMAASGLRVYVGYKVIKPDGKEIIVDLKNAVKMERSGYGGRVSYYKLAIPNLEPGDIIDYYVCHENEEMMPAAVYFFTPFIYNLPQEYPLIKQKLQFKIQRKCYINLRSLNGAPRLKVVNDKENDEQYYSLEDGDRDGVADVNWLYANRDVPTIKFRASFATGSPIIRANTFLGEQGEVKSSVTPAEIAKVAAMITMGGSSKDLSKFIKKNYKKVNDPFLISTEAYNFLRNASLDNSQVNLLEGQAPFEYSEHYFISAFSYFLKSKKIAHDIVVCVRRDISAAEDIILENELDFLIRVKKGSEYLYFSTPHMNKPAGIIPYIFQGTEAYALDGLLAVSSRIAKKITLPSSTPGDNEVLTTLTAKTSDLVTLNMSVTKVHKGLSMMGPQAEFLDVFDAIEDDKGKKYPEVSINNVVFSSRELKKYAASKEAYLAEKPKKILETAKKSFQGDYDFEIKEVTNFKITQTGRYRDKPDLTMSFDFSSDQVIKKTGPNYMVDIGKLIEQQVKLDAEDLDREFGVYFDYPRAFRYRIIFEIPEGYQVQGIEKLNQKVENHTGGFVSTAKEENGKLIIETHKHYDKFILPKTDWQSVVAFVNATNNFTEQKILLKKK